MPGHACVDLFFGSPKIRNEIGRQMVEPPHMCEFPDREEHMERRYLCYMHTPQDPYAGLRAQLEMMEWPAIFPFKFIVPLEKLDEVYQLFKKQDTTTRMSRHGNYASVTATPFMMNPEKVIEVYKKAESIEGLTAL